jgi:LCP family protein required for cell wall assembly
VSKTAGPAVPVRKAVRRHPFRWLFVVILLVVIAWIAYLVTVPIVVWNGVATVDATPTGIDGLPGDQPGTVILIVGSDSRADLSPAERAQLGGPDDSGRTDTMMLLVIPKSGPKTLVSLPRDSYVSIPGHGMNKLNSAYAFGGAPLLVATVELATGVHVDDYVEMDMEGFAGLVDAVGGVEVCLDAPMQDTYAQIDLPAGCQTLDGANALGYARMRYSDPLGDLGRVQRQRELIGKIADKAATPSSVLNPGRYWTLGHAVGAALTRDNTMSALTALRMGLAMVSLGGGKGLSITVPISNPGESTPVGSAVIWDDSGAQELFGAIAQGDTNGLQKFAS